MATNENLGLVHRMYDALNSQDLDAQRTFWTKDMIWHGPPGFGDIVGVDGFTNDVLKPFYASFPDYHVVNEIEVASGDWVAATGILTGTPEDEWLGVPATGKSIVMRFSDFWRIDGGRLAENWVMVDNLGVMQQLADPEAEPWSPEWKQIYATPEEPTSGQENIDLVHRMVDALNATDVDAQDEYWAEDMVWHGPPGFGVVHGIEAFKTEVLGQFFGAFPDFHGEFEIELADDDWVVGTGVVTGTHLGDWFNISPTGKQMEMRYSDFWRIENGILKENWVMIDHLGVLEQLGVDPLEIRW